MFQCCWKIKVKRCKYFTVYDSTVVYRYIVDDVFGVINKYHLQTQISKVFTLDETGAAHKYVRRKDRPAGQVIVENA